MDKESLIEWLSAIDLQRYVDHLNNLGVSRVIHLQDVEEDDLKDIGMSQIEIRRFRRKYNETESENRPSTSPNAKAKAKNISIKLPSHVFGKKELDQSEELLQKKYKELYYVNPQNIKQKMSNSFILKMCASAQWRFEHMKDLNSWAREERSMRTAFMLSLSPTELIAKESIHIKKQNIPFRLEEITTSYKDIYVLCLSQKPPPDMKFERFVKAKEEIEDLLNWIGDAVNNSEKKYESVKGKEGRKEEAEFWLKIKCLAHDIKEKVEETLSQIKKLDDGFQ